MGNRIAKYVYDGTELESSTFYVRDAQGTTIAVYDEKVTIEEIAGVNTPTLKYALAERHIYGSSRLGMDTTEVVIPVNATLTVEPTAETNVSRYLGKRLYELSNHLGNVLTVISDRKMAVPVASSTEFGYYRPHIVSVTDYSPFGVALTARTWSDQEYRYGFQAQEQENEMWGGSVTYKYRVEDPRLGRFFSVDPLSAKYPYYSTYQFSGNRLIDMIELEGLEPAETAKAQPIVVDEGDEQNINKSLSYSDQIDYDPSMADETFYVNNEYTLNSSTEYVFDCPDSPPIFERSDFKVDEFGTQILQAAITSGEGVIGGIAGTFIRDKEALYWLGAYVGIVSNNTAGEWEIQRSIEYVYEESVKWFGVYKWDAVNDELESCDYYGHQIILNVVAMNIVERIVNKKTGEIIYQKTSDGYIKPNVEDYTNQSQPLPLFDYGEFIQDR